MHIPPHTRAHTTDCQKNLLMNTLRQGETLETKAQQCLARQLPLPRFQILHQTFRLLLKCLGWFCTEHLCVYLGHSQRSSYGLGKPSQWALPSGIVGRALCMGKRQHVADTFQRPHLNVYATWSLVLCQAPMRASALGKCAFLHGQF